MESNKLDHVFALRAGQYLNAVLIDSAWRYAEHTSDFLRRQAFTYEQQHIPLLAGKALQTLDVRSFYVGQGGADGRVVVEI